MYSVVLCVCCVVYGVLCGDVYCGVCVVLCCVCWIVLCCVCCCVVMYIVVWCGVCCVVWCLAWCLKLCLCDLPHVYLFAAKLCNVCTTTSTRCPISLENNSLRCHTFTGQQRRLSWHASQVYANLFDYIIAWLHMTTCQDTPISSDTIRHFAVSVESPGTVHFLLQGLGT